MLTLGSKCETCKGYHNPPNDGCIENLINWYIEFNEGYHRTACSDVNVISYSPDILRELQDVFKEPYKEKTQKLPEIQYFLNEHPDNIFLKEILEKARIKVNFIDCKEDE